MRAIEFTLPYPPSVNRYWRAMIINGVARNILSRDGRDYKKKCIKLIADSIRERKIIFPENGRLFSGSVLVSILLHPPTRRFGDVDNYCKAPLDALTESNVWNDDVQVSALYVKRGPIKKGGEIRIHIQEVG